MEILSNIPWQGGTMLKVTETHIKALVADDNQVNTLVLAGMLELFGIQVEQVYSGEDAVSMFRKAKYDLVFIDHIMPDMNGLQATKMLRELVWNKEQTAIFALTSQTFDNIKKVYLEAGANDVFVKPLNLEDIILILEHWFPELQVDEAAVLKVTYPAGSENEDLLKILLTEIPEINYEEGLKYAIGKPDHYAHILNVSLKDIRVCINRIIKYQKQEHSDDLRIAVHNLKSLLSNIGAVELYEASSDMQNLIQQGEYDTIKLHLPEYIIKIDSFHFRLENVVQQYEAMKMEKDAAQQQEPTVLSHWEYEQSLLNTIYYIKSFEYDSIQNELQELIRNSEADLKMELITILEKIKDFDYDGALEMIMKIKEKR
jgi:CheY-like chemotaxis protein